MPHKVSGATRVATIAGYQERAGYQGRGGHRHGGPPPDHVLLTHRAVGRRGQRLGAPRTFLVADPGMVLPCWIGHVAMSMLGAARLLPDVKTVPGWPGM